MLERDLDALQNWCQNAKNPCFLVVWTIPCPFVYSIWCIYIHVTWRWYKVDMISRWWKSINALPYSLLFKLAVSPSQYLKNLLKLISRYLFIDSFFKKWISYWKIHEICESLEMELQYILKLIFYVATAFYMWRKENAFSYMSQ